MQFLLDCPRSRPTRMSVVWQTLFLVWVVEEHFAVEMKYQAYLMSLGWAAEMLSLGLIREVQILALSLLHHQGYQKSKIRQISNFQ